MSLQIEIRTGNTLALTVELEKKQKIYWNDETEAAVKEYLSMDFDHLSSKLANYLKTLRESDKYDSSIEDGHVAELESKIRKSRSDRTQHKKELIFRKKIRTPLNRLIENIIFSFKLFRYDIDVKTLHNDCMSHVYEKFYKFDPDQNTKSFSYFGTIAKHYLQNKKKDLDMLKSINLNYDDHMEEGDERENYELGDTAESDEMMDLFNHMVIAFEKNMNNKALNDNDKKVLDSILVLFKGHGDQKLTSDELEELRKTNSAKHAISGAQRFDASIDDNRYSKGNILDFIADRSKLSKEDMSKSLTKLRNLYKEKKKDFYNKSST